VKSLYYCRSKSLQRSENVAVSWRPAAGTVPVAATPAPVGRVVDYEECLACQ